MRLRPALHPLSGFTVLCTALSLMACTISPAGGSIPDAGPDAGHVQSTNQCATGELTCGANATCLDGPSHCVCNNGYTGDGQTCTDVNECTNGTSDCSANATCTNTPGSYTCQCNTGFTGDGRSCTPSAICTNANGGCSPHATCTQNSNGVSCACDNGYTGDGTTCTAQGLCGSPDAQCDPNANCTNVAGGGYTCQCTSGFTGNGFTCTAINQCTNGTATCGANTVCTPNLAQGGYTCPCASGYTLNNSGACVDINECTNGTAGCAVGATCTNTAGSYTCTCPTGYSGNGFSCTEINACTAHTNDCDDNATCTFTGPGTFTCACKSGYSGSGTACAPIDSCTTDGGSSCPSNSTCASTGPGTYSCTCNSGYASNSGACVAINACANGTNTCGAHAACTFTGPGTYTCACNSGFTGDGSTCTDINECTNGTAVCPGNSTCVNTPGSYTCNCDSGFTSSNGTCTDINECQQGTSNCSLSSNCVNTEGSYYCKCPPGSEGGANCATLKKQLTAGDTFGCSILSGTLSCWGSSSVGAVGQGSTLEELSPTQVGASGVWTAVSAGPGHACGIQTNGSLWCWGAVDASDNLTTPTQYGAGSTWADVAAGNEFSCALQTNGTLWCWGLDNVGQVGDGATTNSTTPHQIGLSTNWETITTGDHHACGMQAGQLWCWGGNESGQVGVGGAVSSTPVLVSTTSNWAFVRAGAEHTCALEEASAGLSPPYSLWCWGNNADGQLGTGPVTAAGPQQVPNPPANMNDNNPTWIQIAPGLNHTCGITTDHYIYCWGDNSFGELGNSSNISVSMPSAQGKVASGNDWDMVASGSDFSCGHHSSGGSAQWQCWGTNAGARLGIGSDASSTTFVTEQNSTTLWQQVSAGTSSACGIVSGGASLECWGDNTYGQLGIDLFFQPEQAPTAVDNVTGYSWNQVSVGATHACAIQGDNSLWCWGDNTYGELGTTPSTTPVIAPQQVGTNTDWVQIAAGNEFTCGIEHVQFAVTNTMSCWGRNDSNQVGSTTVGGTAPITLVTNPSGSSWDTVAVGDAHACAIDSELSPKLWCWGSNVYGQTGVGSQTPVTPTPTETAGGQNYWNSVFLGTGFSCGTTGQGSTNTMVCWGNNSLGQAGQGNTSPVTSPSPILNQPSSWGTNLTDGSASTGYACAIDGSDSLWCWGDNTNGQFGDGTSGTIVTTPENVSSAPVWASIAAGNGFSCTVGIGSQTLGCSGLNDIGQLATNNAWYSSPKP